jgi:hypothetical protein
MPDDEPRDWEELRSDTVRAVRKALSVDLPDAELAADAVLSVIDEEMVRALCAEHVSNTMIRSMDFRNGAALELQPARDLVAYWVGASRALLDGAENYSETTVEFGIPEDPQRYSFVVQKVGKLSPHEARRRAEAERDEMHAEVERLRAGSPPEYGVRFTPEGQPCDIPLGTRDDAEGAVGAMREERPGWGAVLVAREPERPAGAWREVPDACR